ncbi:hypothetical protein UA08_07440 [Talaromyces atroroseus]|uniref:Uncharacterized protein n=1 Tax=Talaromyces atroroseus TaxID=1441469 RepID=A0A225A8Q2_TALAT|nr:hypothetical protein UA08_07440 [Talaromyces atroroseus]OKL57161.1 hypothetical protein UA08_07440 [Talaromyces atroroseus]
MDPRNPDIIKYPQVNPSVILSVSPDAIRPHELKIPISLYVEGFEATEDKTWVYQEEETKETKETKVPRDCFNLYTRKIYGPESAVRRITLGVAGEDGTKEKPNVQGGRGWDGTATTENQPLEDGGDGGNGGSSTVLLGRRFGSAVLLCRQLLGHFTDDGKIWPTDFRDLVRDWVLEMTVDKAIQKLVPLPEDMSDVDQILKKPKEDFHQILKLSYEHLLRPGDTLRNNMTKAIDVNGGTYGMGGRGPNGLGKDGKNGHPGRSMVAIVDESENILSLSTCYLHPVQCQMLLDKAKLFLLLGTEEHLARALTLLERLHLQLSFLGDPDLPEDLSETALGKAYRAFEPLLHIVGGRRDKEPVSFQQLRVIRNEVEKTLKGLLTPKTKSDPASIQVPRASFAFYATYATNFLEELKEIEDTYISYLKDDISEERQRKAIQQRESSCQAAIAQSRDLIQVVRHDMDAVVHKISVAEQGMKIAKDKLMQTMDGIKKKVTYLLGFNFNDLVSAIGMVIFTAEGGGLYWMMANEGLGFAYDTWNKIQNDSGVSIDKKYLVKHIQRIGETVRDLKEGYEIMKDGGVNFSDPGGEKLAMQQSMMETFLNEFSSKLGDETLKEVRKAFEDYINAVQTRNENVLSYSRDVQLLIRHLSRIESLEAQNKDLVRQEYDSLGMEHPTLTAFMRSMYTHALDGVMIWLQGMQNAYQFCALEDRNIIGEEMREFDFSNFNYPMLNRINTRLNQAYAERAQSWGRPPQHVEGVQYMIPDADMDLQDSTPTDMRVILQAVITPHTVQYPSKSPIFGSERVDVRVTSVRFYVDKVSTKSGFLDVWITHSGGETILADDKMPHLYSHQPVKTNFRYKLDDRNYTGKGTVQGEISPVALNPSVKGRNEDPYALVGPFTTWYIEIVREDNDGLDLSQAENPCLEFDVLFRPTRSLG